MRAFFNFRGMKFGDFAILLLFRTKIDAKILVQNK